jgi:hypothetical protein
MASKQQPGKVKTHPDLGILNISVTKFGEIEGSMSIDKINKFLDKNVKDKKLNEKQINSIES